MVDSVSNVNWLKLLPLTMLLSTGVGYFFDSNKTEVRITLIQPIRPIGYLSLVEFNKQAA